jgi:hypothetical protein
MLRRGSVAQSVEQRPFKALVPGSSPGRPSPSETTIYLRKLELSERATRGTKRTKSPSIRQVPRKRSVRKVVAIAPRFVAL